MCVSMVDESGWLFEDEGERRRSAGWVVLDTDNGGGEDGAARGAS
jgi:hypothetical protein